MQHRGTLRVFFALLCAVHGASAQSFAPTQNAPQPPPTSSPPSYQPQPTSSAPSQTAPVGSASFAPVPAPVAPQTAATSTPPPGAPPANSAPQALPPQPTPVYAAPPTTVNTPAVETVPQWSVHDVRFILAVERLFGIYFMTGKSTTDADPASGLEASKTDISSTQVNLLLAESDDNVIGLNPMAIAQLSAHAVVGGGLTIGGSLGAAFDSGEEDTQGRTAQDAPSSSIFVIGPRVGYLLVASPIVSFWLRGGISYYTAKISQDIDPVKVEVTRNGAFVDLDPFLVVTPIAHVGLLLGPLVDIGLAGSSDAKVTDTSGNGLGPQRTKGDLKWTQFGLSAGLAALF